MSSKCRANSVFAQPGNRKDLVPTVGTPNDLEVRRRDAEHLASEEPEQGGVSGPVDRRSLQTDLHDTRYDAVDGSPRRAGLDSDRQQGTPGGVGPHLKRFEPRLGVGS